MKYHRTLPFFGLSLAVMVLGFFSFSTAPVQSLLAAVGVNKLGAFTLAQPVVECTSGAIPVVRLSWTPSSNATSYMVQRKEGTAVSFPKNPIMSQLIQTSYADDRWATNYGRMLYNYRIAGVKGSLRSYSNTISVLLPECATPIATSTSPTPVPTPLPTPIPTPTPVPPPAPTTTPSTGKIPADVKWGAYVGWQDTAMSNFESVTGKQPQMEMVFVHWGNDNFPFYLTPRVKDKGRTMVIFWEAVDYSRDYFNQPEYSFDSVLAGRMDGYFQKFATDAKNYGGEIILIPYSEMNGNWFPWGITVAGNTPEKQIAAYRRIHDFFLNVPNVKFGWAVNSDSVPDTAANRYELVYPGDAYVDIVGVDGFAGLPSDPWMTFDQLFRDPFTRLKQYNKPIYIFSMAAAQDSRKAAWITNALTVELPKWTEVKGILWFNENKERDWRVNSSPEALSAFTSALP